MRTSTAIRGCSVPRRSNPAVLLALGSSWYRDALPDRLWRRRIGFSRIGFSVGSVAHDGACHAGQHAPARGAL